MGVFNYANEKERLQNTVKNEAQSIAHRLKSSLSYPIWNLNSVEVEVITISEMSNKNIQCIEIYDQYRKKNITAIGRDNVWHPIPFNQPGCSEAPTERFTEEIRYKGNLIGAVSVYFTSAFVVSEIQSRTIEYVILVLGITCLVVVALIVLIRIIVLTPLIKLEKAFGVSSGMGRVDLNISRNDEIGMLTRSFLTMQERIASLFTERDDKINELEIVKSDLLQEREDLRVTLESLGEGVIATNMQGVITRINIIAESLTGWTKKEAIHKELGEVFVIVDPSTKRVVTVSIADLLSEGADSKKNFQVLLYNKFGKECLIAVSCVGIKSTDETTVGMVMVFRDITEEKNTQEQLLHGQKMESIGTLAGGIAHDFNNMLSGIIGAANVLKKFIPNDPKAERMYEAIVKTASNAADLTAQLQSLSFRQDVSLISMQAESIVESTLNLLNHSIDKRIEVVADFKAANAIIKGDSTLLENCILNLGINASHAMPDGGSLLFKTEIVDDAYFQVRVKDSGCGMSQALISNIFDPFFTTKKQGVGTGLGLSMVYRVVKEHEGSIAVESELGKGTEFILKFPLTKTTAVVAVADETIKSGVGTILVIDDEPVIRDVIREMLEEIGYQILLAEDGRKGLTIFSENRDSIDLVLLDMIMPEMDGFDCFFNLKKIDKEVIVVLGTGYSDENKIEAMENSGLSARIKKPYHLKELSQVIYDCLKDSSQ